MGDRAVYITSKQLGDDLVIAMTGSCIDFVVIIPFLGINVGARLKQQLDDLVMAIKRSYLKRVSRHSLGIDIGTSLE